MKTILDFNEVGLSHLPEVGGKNSSLGEMITQLSKLGIKVPPGFATTADAYREFLSINQLSEKIHPILEKLDIDDVVKLQEASSNIRALMMEASLPKSFEDEILQAYRNLRLKPDQTVAVRSSATAEDLPEASFAGQQETYLNVTGEENILLAVKRVYASLFTERAIAYRTHHEFKHEDVAISAGIQQMVRSDLGASGVMFTLDTESGFDQVVFITAALGLGETIVQGAVNPDEFYVHKPTLNKEKASIISRKLGSKAVKMIYANTGERVKTVPVDEKEQGKFCINDDEILILAKQALVIEKHYRKPMDIEWAKDGMTGEIYIIQARPETVKGRENESGKSQQVIEQFRLIDKAEPITTGRSVGQKMGQGKARLIKDPKQMHALKPGEVLVADMTDPDWEPVMKRAVAIVTNRGGRTCHAAIIARELGIPAVIGCGDATDVLSDGQELTVSCAEGETGYIYPGLLQYEVEKTEIKNLPDIPVKLRMNLANPDIAFSTQFIPNEGVGLARLEFVIGSMVGIHPNAILKMDKTNDEVRAEIMKKTSAYETPVEFYIEKIAEGVSTIAAAFYPKPVIVRFSDFKSNEYMHLLGGEFFEPEEENPMIGYRGASRYLSGNFTDCFALECEAIKRVRDKKGLYNTHVMFPFVRTVAEAKQLAGLIKLNGLVRGRDGLQTFMMCEIPSNVILAEDFLEYFDGYSIGSNDLTQLTLGLDRDSELVADLFDERDPAVKALLKQVIATCRRLDKQVGICGQGPSDHPDLAKWLMQQGIDSISLNPDSVVKTWTNMS